MKKLDFLIVDDHAIIRRGLLQILSESFVFSKTFEAGNAKQALEILKSNTIGLVILDISLPDKNGLELLKDLKILYPETPVLMLSIYPEDQYAVRVIKAGASGYLNKDLAPEELIGALQEILSGRTYISQNLKNKLANNFLKQGTKLGHEELSDREYQVFLYLANGKTVSQIASDMNLSVNTISTYRARILDKTELKNNAEIMKYAIEHKLLK